MRIATCAFNAGTDALLDAVEAAVADEATDAVLIVVPASAAGADRGPLVRAGDAAALFSGRMRLHRRMRALEQAGTPIAAALCGTAIGIGFELALMAHYRVAVDDPTVRFGIDDVSFGLIPGAGATQRLPRTIGIAASVQLLLEGRTLGAREALDVGIADALAVPGDEIAAAMRWLERPRDVAPVQPWDEKGFTIPGGAVQSGAMLQYFTAANAMLRERTFGNYPAATAALSCVYEGLQTDIDTGLKIESRYFVHAALAPSAKNMVRLASGVRDAMAPKNLDVYTRRVLATYVAEGLAMLGGGVAPALIDNAGRIAGMPAGPLALADEVTVAAVCKIDRAERPAVEELVERLIAIQSIEAARCFEERVVERAIDADVGALLGWGYPAFRGGPLAWIDTIGVERFVSDTQRLAERFGPRFSPPEVLLEMTAQGRRFYD